MKDRTRVFSDRWSLILGLPVVAVLIALFFALLLGLFCLIDAQLSSREFNWQLVGRGTLYATVTSTVLLIASDTGRFLISFIGASLSREDELTESTDIESEKWF